MSAKKTPETAPIKRLILRRETVRDMNVRTGVKTGGSGDTWRGPGSVVASAPSAPVSHIKPPPPQD